MAVAELAPMLELADVSKDFGGARALDSVSLNIREGEIHALVGQNGSGKSTLIKILTGFHDPEEGIQVRLRGEPARLSRSQVETSGDSLPIRVVHQDAGLVAGLNAVDNIALGAGYQRGSLNRIDWPAQRRFTSNALRLVHAEHIDQSRPVGGLEVVQRAQIAIARALVGWEERGGLLLLDEPTAALSETEANELFEVLGKLRAAGMSILYVSHRLDEVLRIADRITVIRDGHWVDTRKAGELTYDQLVELMVGGRVELSEGHRTRDAVRGVEPSPEAVGATHGFDVESMWSPFITNFSVSVSAGEIVGVTGLAGAGHEQLPDLVMGVTKSTSGSTSVGGTRYEARRMTPRLARAAGMALVPGERTVSGLVMGFDIGRNVSLPRIATFVRTAVLRQRAEQQDAKAWVDSLEVNPARLDVGVATLSGGNQQKVVLAKCLGVATGALILADPTAGVDVGARAAIYRRICLEAARGLPVLVCSSDPEDLVHLCDRVLVMSKGVVVQELQGAGITKESILHACGRHTPVPSTSSSTPREDVSNQ